MFPMKEIAADGMAPAHVAPFVAERIELVEEMILAVIESEAVGIVHPIRGRRKMKLRPPRLTVKFRAHCRKYSAKIRQCHNPPDKSECCHWLLIKRKLHCAFKSNGG